MNSFLRAHFHRRSHFLDRLRHGGDERNSLNVQRRFPMTNHGIKTIIYPVKDVARAKALFSKLLGGQPYADAPYYIGYRVGEQEIGLLPSGHASGMTAPLGYFHVEKS